MSDTICSVCATPKPPCCYDFAGSGGNVCQPCHRDAVHNRRAARERSPRNKAARLRRTNKLLATHPEQYANQIATSLERRGA